MKTSKRQGSSRIATRIIRTDKCLAVKISDGHTLVCWRSPGHVDSAVEDRRRHYDPSAEKYWLDRQQKKGKK